MDYITIYNDYKSLGIDCRSITEGEENDMVNDFIDYKVDNYKSKQHGELAVFKETKIANSFPDLLFVEYDPFAFDKWNDKRASLTPDDIKILYYIYEKYGVSSDLIIKRLSINSNTCLKSLEHLLDANLIQRKNGKWSILDRKSIFGIHSIEAVEAKIGKFDEVTQQAISNATFASKSSILCKRKTNYQDKQLDFIKMLGLGAYRCNDAGFESVVDPLDRKYPNNFYSIYINECLGKVLTQCNLDVR